MYAIDASKRRLNAVVRWSFLPLLLVTASCADILSPGIGTESPGILLTGLEGACPTIHTDYNQCLAWSADGLTLFVVLARPSDTVLVAVDIAAAATYPPDDAYRIIGRVGLPLIIATSQDPRTIFFSRRSAAEAGGFEVLRMSLADGVTSRITGAAAADIIATPDGSGLAYHAFRGSLALDTVALIDVASGLRRAATGGVASLLRGISPDGRDVGLKALVGDSAVIWHTATSARETANDGTGVAFAAGVVRSVIEMQWARGGFSILYRTLTGELTEVSAATGVGVAYAPHVTKVRGAIAWSPAVARALLRPAEQREVDCFAHCLVTRVLWVKMVTRIVLRQELERV